jgi:ubiquinone/menaquinone biosynthesis C-methylase UbiE
MSADFDRWASGYDDSPLQPIFHAAHAAVLKRIRELGIQPRRVLDIGCGTGQLLREIATALPTATPIGLDPSLGMLRAGMHGAGKKPELVRAQAERLPFTDGSFDLVLATASYRHWRDPLAAMREISRILGPSGWFVLADIFAPRKRLLWSVRGHPVPASLRTALAEADLATGRVASIAGYGPIPSITLLTARARAERLAGARR